MRIDKLKLTRFGSFTDKSIDFGPAVSKAKEPDPIDLHVVFGPNEAGKSTVRSAVESFLYGIPLRTGYDFLHNSKTLQIEAQVSAGNKSHELTRIKRNTNSLLGPDNQPIGDGWLTPMLSGIDRETYSNMFSMDEDSLERGGNSILESRGEVGELLFSSTSGLAALGSELAQIRLETEGFYKARSQKVGLKQKTEELKALRDQIKALDVPASQFVARKKEAAEAKLALDALKATREDTEAEKIRLKALLDCVTPWRDFVANEEVLATMEVLPSVPPAWIARAQKLSTESTRLDTQIDLLRQRITDAQAQMDAIEVEQPLIDAAPEINRLVDDDIEARYRAASGEQGAEAAVEGLAAQIQRNIAGLSAPEGLRPEQLPLPVGRVGQIKALIERRLVLETNLQSATEEAMRAETGFDAAAKAHTALAADSDLSELAQHVAIAREQDLGKELERRQSEMRRQHSDVEQVLLTLEPWKGAPAELKALEIPPTGELTVLEARSKTNLEALGLLHKDGERLEAELTRLQADRDTLRAAGELVDDASAQQSRDERDKRWRAHRQALAAESADSQALNESADKFQSALSRDDALVATRIGQTADLAKLRELNVQLARAQAEQERVSTKVKSLDAAQAELVSQQQVLCASLGLPATVSISELLAWLPRRVEALREIEKLKSLQTECEQLQVSVDRSSKKMEVALKAASLAVSKTDLSLNLQTAEAAVANWQEQIQAAKEARRILDEATQEQNARKQRMATSSQALDDWNQEWAEALRGLWLSEAERAPTTTEVAEILRALDELAGLLTKANDAQVALTGIQDSRARYLQEVTQIAEALTIKIDADNPLQTADLLRKRLAAAQASAQRKSELTQELERLQATLTRELGERRQSKSAFSEMISLFPADNFDGLIELMQRGQERERAVDASSAAKTQLVNLLGLSDFQQAKQQLQTKLNDAAAIEVLKVEHATAVADNADLNEEVSRLFHNWRAAEEALASVSDDGEVARLNEQARVLLLDIEAETRRFIALSAGTLAVERALRTYVEKHRSTLLARASDAFATITRGAFTGLDAMPGVAGQSKEELVGKRADGSSTSATQMSRGSRFQLYLSLRIAGYHEFVAQREPLPFFADDILETFDDDRSAETFALMAEMAKQGQVIYLTHHKHLCEIAKKVTNGRAKIYELPARSLQDLTHA